MSNDTMDARYTSVHGEKYSQVFGNKQFFVEAYPIKRKADFLEGLDKFVKTYGSPAKFIYDGAVKKVGSKTNFRKTIRKYQIEGHVSEKGRSN